MVLTRSASDLAVGVERHLGMGDVVAAMRVGEERLGAVATTHFTGRPTLLRGPEADRPPRDR